MFKTNEIRSEFLNYFAQNDHEIVRASSLVPHNDPTLMFTNSGMVPFKNIFTGIEERKYKRATSSQKSVRAGGKHNDLDNVGYTARHHTFFEMLGNFSFGDYFKEEAIFYAWTFLTKNLNLPKDKLYVTVFHEDDQAANYWKKIAGLSDDRIIKIKTNDNFWSMGDTGPCGPCSEIFYDHGESIWGGLPGTKDENGDRFIEIWNLVFMQYEQLEDGSQMPLPKPCIDTGMGLERITAVMQGVHNNYEIDLFKNIIEATSDITRIAVSEKNVSSFRVIADHLRSVSFLIADGVMPSNEGRGYVLRRIMRRAMRHIHQIGSQDVVMHKLVNSLVNEMGEAYPEIVRAEPVIKEMIYQEENKFRVTLAKGLKLLDDAIDELGSSKVFPGNIAFNLYDTYGFPLDLTIDILKNKKISVNIDEFDQEMLKQKEKARAAWKGSGDKVSEEAWFDILDSSGATEFVGYENNVCEAIIVAKIKSGEGDLIVTNQTPFYGESGGQIGDKGFIIGPDNTQIEVIETKKYLGKIHAHLTKASNLNIGDVVRLEIDSNYRQEVRRNHSATHLLHYILRKKLGEHVVQKGSLVANNYFRFDFAHQKALTSDELAAIEIEVNRLIMINSSVNIALMNLEDATKTGAMALFGEKYDDEVRVIKMGASVELCGGTHVNNTGDIGLFKIKSESSIASGIRRIEALTGEYAVKYTQEKDKSINELSLMLKVNNQEIEARVETLLTERKKLEKEIKDLKQKVISGTADDDQIIKIGEYNLIIKIEENIAPAQLREYVDSKRNDPNAVIFAASIYEEKTSLIVALGRNLTDKFNAANLAKEACSKAGGVGGGGRADIAQAGGYNYADIENAIAYIKTILS